MADSDTQNPNLPENKTPEEAAVPIQVNVQYIKDFSFENPRAPMSLQPTEVQPDVEVNVDVNATRLGDTAYEVTLVVTVNAANPDGPLFVTELTYGGLFTLTNIPEEHMGPVLLIECPRLLFPFARAIIADATREGGFSPLLIQPIDFAELFRRTQEQAKANAEAEAEAAGSAPATDTIQ